jgi:hypothetical protein
MTPTTFFPLRKLLMSANFIRLAGAAVTRNSRRVRPDRVRPKSEAMRSLMESRVGI